MQAIRVHQYGGPEVLTLEQIPKPQPQEGEILVRVLAAGVLPADCATRRGGFAPRPLPYIPGTAFAGVVEALGVGVTKFQIGQAVCGRSANGTYAEYTTVQTNPPPVDTSKPLYLQSAAISPLALKPRMISFDEAATLSAGATTAWTAVIEDGAIEAGQRVLIHGGAGGVGLFAVQFAHWKGAQVITTASAANLDFVHLLGADMVIDYNTSPFEQVAGEVDFVLDTIGGDTLRRSMQIVKRGGALVSIVDVPSADLAQQLGIRATKNETIPNSGHLQKIVELIDAGSSKPTVQRAFSLDEAAQAHELCETGHGRGRIVLHIAD